MRNILYIRNNNTVCGRLHNELVMMDIKRGKYYSLNQVATHIWDMLDQPQSIENICAKLLTEFQVQEEQCYTDVKNYLTEMQKKGLVSTGD